MTPVAHKPADATKPAASESGGWSLSSLVSGALSTAETIATAAAAVGLPGLQLVEGAASYVGSKLAPTASDKTPAKPSESHTGQAAPAPDKAPATGDKAPATTDKTPATGDKAPAPTHLDLGTATKSHDTTGNIDLCHLSMKNVSLDLGSINKDYSIDDILKIGGCDTGNSCSVTAPGTPGASFSQGGFNFKSTDKPVTNDKIDTDADVFFGAAKLNDAFNVMKSAGADLIDFASGNSAAAGTSVGDASGLDKKPAAPAKGDKPAATTAGTDAPAHQDKAAPGTVTNDAVAAGPAGSDKPGTVKGPTGHIEKTANGFAHVNALGQVDFQRQGNDSIKHNADGTTSQLDSATHIETVKNADGTVKFRRLADGSFEFPGEVAGSKVIFAKDGKTARVLTGTGEQSFDVVNGKLVPTTSRVLVAAVDGNLPQGKDLLKQLQSVFTGKFEIKPYKDGMAVFNADGSIISVNKDGSGMMTLDKHSWLVRGKDGHLEIQYNDGRHTQILSEAQMKTMMADPAVGKQLKDAFQQLQNFSVTGILQRAGSTIKQTKAGLVGSTQGVEASAGSDGSEKIVDHNLKLTTLVAASGDSARVLDDKGQEITNIKSDPVKGLTVADTGVYVKNGAATTADGSVYSASGIKFADGTNFQANGNITANDGATYNTSGEMVAWEDPTKSSSGSSSGGSSDASAKSDEAKAHAQVSQAESMASSLMGKVSSGHATAGDIAALLGSFEKLSVLVSSLSQLPDSSLMAAAVIAQGEVASSIAVAYANLGQHEGAGHDKTNGRSDAAVNAAGSRPMATV
jgi:hypothetical protein